MNIIGMSEKINKIDGKDNTRKEIEGKMNYWRISRLAQHERMIIMTFMKFFIVFLLNERALNKKWSQFNKSLIKMKENQ